MTHDETENDHVQRKNNHRKTRDSLQTSIESYLNRVGKVGDPDALRLLLEARNAFQTQQLIEDDEPSNEQGDVSSTLREIKQSLERIEKGKHIAKIPKSYAGAAAEGARKESDRRATSTTAGRPNRPDLTQRAVNEATQARVFTVTISVEEEKDKLRRLSTKELVETLQRNAPGIHGVTRLASGDIRIHTESVEAKKTLSESSEFLTGMAASAMVQRRTYIVQASDVKVEHVQTSDQDRAIQYLHTVNARLHPNLKIVKISWSTKAIREKKLYSTLRLEVATPTMANRLITEGLLVDYEIKHCEKLSKGNKLMQCFNCYKYGHKSRYCKLPTRCGRCAGEHLTDECSAEITGGAAACAGCDSRGHVAWSLTAR